MGYTFTMPDTATGGNTVWSSEFRFHDVLLRRLTNPYLPANDPTTGTFNAASPVNRYITVDMLSHLPAFDAIHRFIGDGSDRKPRDKANPNGYDPVAERFSVGKVQPMTGRPYTQVSTGAGNYNKYVFPDSMQLDQRVDPKGKQSADPADAGNTANAPKNTFGRHNGTTVAQPAGTTFVAGNPGGMPASQPSLTDTIMLPFDWQVHMDRPLVNQAELFQVRDCAPHLLAFQFAQSSSFTGQTGVPGVYYDSSYARWRYLSDGVARGLELLTVRPYGHGLAHGGRVTGQLDLNAIRDQRVLAGLLDPQAGNAFDTTFVDSAWANWMNTRDGVISRPLADGTNANTAGTPTATIYDAAGGTNRPFLPFGAPAASGGGSFAFTNGGNIDQTILRRLNANSPPLLWLPDATAPSYSQDYRRAEAVRKMLNNSTTVSHTFVVFMTIGYFEVVEEFPTAPPGWPAGLPVPPTMGAEVFIAVPGDMRQKYVAMVDMSNMALDAVNPVQAGVTPFFTSLEQTTYASGGAAATLNVAYARFDGGLGTLYFTADGQEVAVKAGDKLVLGYGVEQQLVTVSGVGTGQLSVTADNGVFRTAWGGTCVSNVRPGYPGPQPTFDYNSATYKPVVPYVELMR